jgi:hypothetical protein
MNELSRFLVDAYSGGSGRATEGTAEVAVKIEDQTAGDRGLCRLIATVVGPDTSNLQLTNCPMTDELRAFARSCTGLAADTGIDNAIQLRLSVKQVGVIRKLASIIRRTVGRGRRYQDPNWKWICPRTADSLEQFADKITAWRRERANRTGREVSAARPAEISSSSTGPTHTAAEPPSGGAGDPRTRRLGESADDEDLFKICGIE